MTIQETLDQINAEINGKPTPKKKVIGGPQDKHDKKAWRRMYNAGYKVLARRTNNNYEPWYEASRTTFDVPSEREFKIAYDGWDDE